MTIFVIENKIILNIKNWTSTFLINIKIMKKNIICIIPTLGNQNNIKKLLTSIQNQTILPSIIYLILDKKITLTEKQEFLYFLNKNFSKLNIIFVNNLDYDFQPQRGVSYVRNFGLNLASKMWKDSDFIVFIDDDIFLEDNFIFKKILNHYKKSSEILIFPIVINWFTRNFENAGIKWISPFTLKLNFIKPKGEWWSIKMCSLQFLFWPLKIFKNFKFDERFKFVYEDLDFTRSLTENWIKILGFSDIKVLHFDKKTKKVEKAYVSNPFLAYQKWKNRILFAKKHFTLRQKIIFFSIGFWIHSLYLILLILLQWNKKWNSIKAFIKGSFKGLK